MRTQTLSIPGAERNDGSLSYYIANVTSYVLNPLCLPPISAAFWVAHFGAARSTVWGMLGESILFFCILPLAYIVWMVRSGQTSSLEIRERTARTKPLWFGMACSLVGGFVMSATLPIHASVIWSIVGTHMLVTLIMLIITQWWKISLHLTGLSGFVTLLYFVTRQIWLLPTRDLITSDWVLPLFLTIPLLMWARVRVGAHTKGQVVAGAMLSFLLTYLFLHIVNVGIFDAAW